IYYSRVNSVAALKLALQQAVADGVDIVNMSFGWPSPGCDPTFNPDGLNDVLTSTYNQGLLLVASAGNDGYGGSTCNIWYPNWRPEIMAVNGLDTSSASTAYNSTSLSVGAANHGQAPISLYGPGGWSVSMAGIAVSAPGVT